MLICVENHLAAVPLWNFHWYDFIFKLARLDGCFAFLLGIVGEIVHFFSRDTPLLRYGLCRDTHMKTAECIRQSVSQHSILERYIAHAGAPSGFLYEIRCHRHTFRSACQYDFRIARLNHLSRQADGSQTGATHFIYGERRNLFRNTCAHSRQSRNTLALACLKNTTEYDFIDLIRRDSSTFYSFFHNDFAQFHRCHTI